MTPDDLQAFGKTLAVAKRYADIILKPPLEQVGGILGDTIGHFRLKNQVRLVLKTKAFLEERKISPQKLLPSVFIPLVEEAGNTDDESLSNMFAALLTSHLDPTQQDSVHPSFAKVLGQLSPLDVQVLLLIDEKEREEWESAKAGKPHRSRWNDHSLTLKAKETLGEISAGQIQLSFENLVRLGIVEFNDVSVVGETYVSSAPGIFIPKFGHRLLVACNKPTYWRYEQGDSDEKRFQRSLTDQKNREELNDKIAAAAAEKRRTHYPTESKR